jgi:cytochrome c553
MRRLISVLTSGLALLFTASVVNAVAQHPSWAYGFVDPPPARQGAAPAAAAAAPAAAAAAPAPDTTLHELPGSTRKFTRAQASDQYGPADWFPDEHPTPPPIVAHGRENAAIGACGWCHYVGGRGRQENAGLAGLPYEYFVQTMLDFRNGKRGSADPRKANTLRMITFAKAMTMEEIEQAAKYFSSMPWKRDWIKVVETRAVPKSRTQNGVFVFQKDSGTEPIGTRIVEGPEDMERFELRDPHSGFIAYVPPGSIKAGETLVKTGGGGKTVQCGICHGPTLDGSGPVPGLAGRDPSYVVRQLYDMQVGTRHGTWSALMKPVVEKLTVEDLVAIGAYLAQLKPSGT